MAIRRKPTPKGKPYVPNPEPKEEYTATVNAARMTRLARKIRKI